MTGDNEYKDFTNKLNGKYNEDVIIELLQQLNDNLKQVVKEIKNFEKEWMNYK